MNLAKYAPSKRMLRAFELKFSDEALHKIDQKFDAYLTTLQLNAQNVSSVLAMLIAIEDIHTMNQYSLLCQSNVVIKTKRATHRVAISQTNNGLMCIPYVDEVVLLPSGTLSTNMQPTQRIPELLKDGMIFEIYNVTQSCVVFAPKVISNTKLTERFYDVIIRNPRIPFRLMYRSLNMFEKADHARQYMFPVFGTQIMKRQLLTFPLLNSLLASNPEQLMAVQQIVSGPNPIAPYIIFGPPGTGKTYTIVEAILQLYLRDSSARILVTAASNWMCSSIILKMIDYFEKDARFQLSSSGDNNGLLRLVSRSAMRKQHGSMNPLELKYSNYADIRKKKGSSKRMHPINIDAYKIIVTTLCSASIHAQKCKKPFTHIFIDEAASASEADILLAIAGIKQKACHVILAGDHKQLGPIVKSERASSLGLARSSMERLLLHKLYEVDSSGNYDKTLQSRLRRNYRSHPEIVGIYNELYYNSELIPMAPLEQVNQAAKWSELPNGKFPILFQAAHGKIEMQPNSTSKFNTIEAEAVCWFVTNLLNGGLGEFTVEQKDIGIVTPYLAQCRLLTALLRSIEHEKVNVGTVESYQGREKPIIIVSLVTSFKGTRFFSNPGRMNVMLSRAKSLLILIGNPKKLRKIPDFKFIINQCIDKGTLLKKKKDFWLKDIDKIIAKLNFQCDEDENEVENEDENEDEDGDSISSYSY